MKRRQIYSRRRYFKKNRNLTALSSLCAADPKLSPMQVMKPVKAENYKGGVKLTAKDLRDVFGTIVMDNVRNAIRRAA